MDKRSLIQEEASQVVLTEKDLILFISIRLGKTRIALKAIEVDETILIVYPNSTIKNSWLDELIKFKPLSTNIVFTTKNSLKHHKDKYYDTLILDEPQLMQSKKQIDLIKTIKFKKRIALTGTLNVKTIKKLDEELGLKVKFRYDISDAIKDKLVKDYRINIHFTELNNQIANIKYKSYGKDVIGTEEQAYNSFTQTMNYFSGSQNIKFTMGFKKYMGIRTNFLYNSGSLLKLASDLVLKHKHEKVLIYTMRQEIADKLSNITYHSKSKNEVDLDNFKISTDGHLSVVNCVQAGVTIKNLNRVIFHTYESNTEIFYQKLGRSLLYEFKGEVSNIHICVLRGTQMEKWANNACKALEQDKIVYHLNGNTYNKVEWVKLNYPDKQLFMYNGSICYLFSEVQRQFSDYIFIDNPERCYSLNRDSLMLLK